MKLKPPMVRSDFVTLTIDELELTNGGLISQSASERISLAGRELANLSVNQATFSGSDFSDAQFRRGQFWDVTFTDCDFAGANFTEAGFHRVQFRDCRLVGTQFEESSLKHVSFASGRAESVGFRFCELETVAFSALTLRDADFSRARLTDAAFDRCDLAGAEFDQAILSAVDLRSSSLLGIARLGSLAGATIDSIQLVELAPQLAKELGLRIN